MSEFVRQRMELVRRAATYAPRAATSCSPSEAEVVARRAAIAGKAQPSILTEDLIRQVAQRQAIGDQPKTSNENKPPKAVAIPKVRKATGKFVRGAFAESLPMVMAFRNTPDHLPEPIQSNWSTEPTSVIAEVEFDEVGAAIVTAAEDLALEIRPSIRFVEEQIRTGPIVRAAPKPLSKAQLRRGLRQQMQGPITAIGKLKFSDGTHRHRVTMRTEAGIVTENQEAPAGTMLGIVERVGAAHGGDASGVAHMSNTRTTALFLGQDQNRRPTNWRPFMPKGEIRRGRSLTRAESRALIEEASANTTVTLTVTKCPPGVASGTARFSEQFVGLVSGSTGKGGAPNWVEHFVALEERNAFLSAVAALDDKSRMTLVASTTARTFADVGIAVGQGAAYARRAGGKLALVAANDNFATVSKKLAA